MADLRGPRAVTWLVPLLLVIAVVVAVLVVGGADDDQDPGPDDARSTPSPTSAPTAVDPDTWCDAFRRFAGAQSQYVGTPDDPAAQDELEASADDLLGLGQPLGLSDGGLTSLQVLVDGALSEAGDPTVAPGAAPEDPQALADYLTATCPA